MKEKFAKLIDVKSIMTLGITAVVMYLAVVGKFDIKDIYLMIVAFYFGTQSVKKEVKSNEQSTSNKE